MTKDAGMTDKNGMTDKKKIRAPLATVQRVTLALAPAWRSARKFR
jgi:hypothetical protein